MFLVRILRAADDTLDTEAHIRAGMVTLNWWDFIDEKAIPNVIGTNAA